jgi:membrane protease YdiL (CAAX protease family)
VNPALLLLAMALAALTAAGFDRATERRGVLPPAFSRPGRRTAALLWTGFVFLVALFLPLAVIGAPQELPTPEALRSPALFVTQALLAGSVVVWFLLGYGGVRWPPVEDLEPVDGEPAAEPVVAPRLPLIPTFLRQFGLIAARPGREILIGLGAAVAGWIALVAVMLAVVLILLLAGQTDLVPTAPPAMVPLLAGLPIVLRIGLSLSAGVVEELFFRGFLQARIGVLASTALFALAHLSYGQPFMLIGITVLSLFFSALVVWRRSILAAIAAHFAFDAVQLLFVIPQVLESAGGGS